MSWRWCSATLLVTVAGVVVTSAGAGRAGSADMCLPLPKLPPGVKLPSTGAPPGYVKLPPGVTYPGAVPCPAQPAAGAGSGSKSGAAGPHAVLTGAVTGTPLPAHGSGRAAVLAIGTSGSVAGASWLGEGGRYRLSLPSGAYVLATWVADLKKRTFAVVGSGLTQLSGGAHRTLPLRDVVTGKRKAAARRPAGGGPGGLPPVPTPAGENWVQIDPATGATGEMTLTGNAMQAMLITSLAAARGRPDCTVKVSSLNFRVEELIAEARLQASPAFDPSTRVPIRWVTPNVQVRDTISNNDAKQTVTISLNVVKNGKSAGTVSRTFDYDSVFDASDRLAQDILDIICQKPPKAYEGSVSGSAKFTRYPGENVTVSWDGRIKLVEVGDQPSGPSGQPGTWRIYRVDSGSLVFRISGGYQGCSATGQATVPATGAGQITVRIDGDRHDYQPTIPWQGGSVPTTFAGAACSSTGAASGPVALADGDLARTDKVLSSTSWALDGSADYSVGTSFSEHMTWALAPASS